MAGFLGSWIVRKTFFVAALPASCFNLPSSLLFLSSVCQNNCRSRTDGVISNKKRSLAPVVPSHFSGFGLLSCANTGLLHDEISGR